ncbi:MULTISPECIES: hypothetical protein [Metabacillus]|jgi:hypothetical protein|uniref:Uncharacterized protein n=1 Tax=Metabacillus hrfriensis TaxID=3048891 RepID=A0ACD4RCM8_9BACI|nr:MULTISPECIES: hypothetical protein [Metabacillus]UOK58369.1 hypothetical protein MGI18_03440 [Bacillus sp. OVS6]USK29042.1 hypothetical protein LIT32_02500 [Bacillus sp. CMF21]MDR0139250.1 hypothetical protein [Metabacillus idriensis]UAL52724.1 hypothetical protein K8L98_02460 [Metabacillus dongyingensis]WHZ58260.1 hypothetical protein QLQ22_02485 [Metabacillus sp. CT-WN-B3]
MSNYDKNKKRSKEEADDAARGGCMLPGCIDFFIIPLQVGILGYQFINMI